MPSWCSQGAPTRVQTVQGAPCCPAGRGRCLSLRRLGARVRRCVRACASYATCRERWHDRKASAERGVNEPICPNKGRHRMACFSLTNGVRLRQTKSLYSSLTNAMQGSRGGRSPTHGAGSIPLGQHIQRRHGTREACVDVCPAPVQDLCDMADERQPAIFSKSSTDLQGDLISSSSSVRERDVWLTQMGCTGAHRACVPSTRCVPLRCSDIPQTHPWTVTRAYRSGGEGS